MRKRFRPSHGTLVAYVALFIALGGTTYAATGGNFILGKSNSASTATQLSSGAGNALKVSDTNGGTGVYASGGSRSKATAAVHGQSGAGNGVEGYSTANPSSGVFGQDNGANSYGVAGHSDNGVAVVGDSSSGWAMQALGNATQTRARNGFVKAMAYVNNAGGVDPIKRCFNSQLPPSQATSGDCGITFSSTEAGNYVLDFGFQVNDRLYLVTQELAFSQGVMAAAPTLDTTKLRVTSVSPGVGQVDSPFFIFVF
jgi:hypothetical protein